MQNFGDIFEVNFLAIEFFGGAKSEILHEEQIDLVAIGGGLFLLAQLTLEKGAQILFAGVQSFGRKLADLKGADACVNSIEPFQHAVEHFARGALRRQFAGGIRQRAEIKLGGESRV